MIANSRNFKKQIDTKSKCFLLSQKVIDSLALESFEKSENVQAEHI